MVLKIKELLTRENFEDSKLGLLQHVKQTDHEQMSLSFI